MRGLALTPTTFAPDLTNRFIHSTDKLEQAGTRPAVTEDRLYVIYVPEVLRRLRAFDARGPAGPGASRAVPERRTPV